MVKMDTHVTRTYFKTVFVSHIARSHLHTSDLYLTFINYPELGNKDYIPSIQKATESTQIQKKINKKN